MAELSERIKFQKDSHRDRGLQTEILNYYGKLKNEIEALPKEYKKFFRNSLKKHSFDMEVYIPHLTESNKKIYTNKNYLINKLIRYEKFLHSVKKKKEKSFGLANFSKYSYLIENNIKQREYLTNLLKIYKDKGYEINNIEYKKKDNIFYKSILLDHELGEDISKDVLKYGNNKENTHNFIYDNKLLLRFKDFIHECKSPNAQLKNKVSNNILNNDLIKKFNNLFINKENTNNKKINVQKIKKKKVKRKNRNNEMNKSSEENMMNKNRTEEILDEQKTNDNNNDEEKNNNNNNSNNNSKIDKTITTYYGNDSLIFNESKNSKIIEDIQNPKKEKISLKHKSNYINKDKDKNEKKKIKFNLRNTYDNDCEDNAIKNFSLREYSNNVNKPKKKNKYLLTSLNKVKISQTKEKESSTDNLSPKENDFSIMKKKFQSKKDLKIVLPEINPIIKSYKKQLTSNDKIDKNKTKTINKINNLRKIYTDAKNINHKLDYDKCKTKEINKLFTTINYKTNIFENFPSDRVEKYFLSFKKKKIPKINQHIGSNIHPLLEGLQNIVEGKDIYKIAKSLNETKKDMYLRINGTLDNFDKVETLDFEKIKDYDNKIPLLKYDFAENILFRNDAKSKKRKNY